MKNESGRLQILDLLRFCAATSVMVYHLTYLPGFVAPGSFIGIGAVSRFGFLGVELFFLISGFVILWSADNRSAPEFAISRFSRLMPSYWVSMAITGIGLAILTGATYTPFQIAANATMTAGLIGTPYVDGVYWTLLIELKFYVLVFALTLFHQMRRLEYWLGGWVVALVIAHFVPLHALRSLVIYPYGAFFAAGGFFFLWWKNGLSVSKLVALLVCCALSCIGVFHIGQDFLGGAHTPFALRISMAVVVLLYLLFAAISSGRVRVGHAALWANLGAMTYPLYLLHNSLGKAIAADMEPFVGSVGAVVLSACISLTLAFILARTTERYGCSWLRTRLLNLLRPRAAQRIEPSGRLPN